MRGARIAWSRSHKTAVAVDEYDFTELQASFLLPFPRSVARPVVAPEKSEGIDSEPAERPVAVLGNECEPLSMFFLQVSAPPEFGSPYISFLGKAGSVW
jgi:hypothetical protein